MVIYTDLQRDPEYYEELSQEIENGGVEGFYAWLLDYPLEDFRPWTQPIDTEAHKALKALGKGADARFIDEWISGDLDYEVGPAASRDIYRAFQLWAKSSGEKFIPSSTAFFTRLGRVMRCERKRVDVFRGDVGIDDARVQDGPHFGQTVNKQLKIYFPASVGDKDPDIILLSEKEIGESVRKFQLTVAKAEDWTHGGDLL